jgi:hypothetical protein
MLHTLHPKAHRRRIRELMKDIVAWLCVLALAGPAAHAAGDEYIEYTGAANAHHGPDFLYGERHILLYRDGRLSERTVLYTCANGAPFARKTVTYLEPAAPDFYFVDASNGMQEGVRSRGGARSMFFRASLAAPEKSAPLPDTSELVVDAGFDTFIQAHWSELMRGAPVPLRFLVPSRLQVMDFEVQHLRSDSFDGRPTEVFRMKLSGILGLLFSGIDVAYGASDHLLVHYDGLSDVRDPAGANLQANIVFHAGERRPSSPQAVAAAEAATLAPCH